jgi:hypothetical protein
MVVSIAVRIGLYRKEKARMEAEQPVGCEHSARAFDVARQVEASCRQRVLNDFEE